MIQRIQTLYLVIALISSTLLFFFPLITLKSPDNIEYTLRICTLKSNYLGSVNLVQTFIFNSILQTLVLILCLVSIFLFKNRPLQLKVGAFAFLFNAIVIVSIFYLSDKYSKEFNATASYDNIGIILPFVTLIFLVLANRAIKKDEMKLKKSRTLR